MDRGSAFGNATAALDFSRFSFTRPFLFPQPPSLSLHPRCSPATLSARVSRSRERETGIFVSDSLHPPPPALPPPPPPPPSALLFFLARPAYSAAVWLGSTFQNVCKRPEHPAHPNTVHTLEKVESLSFSHPLACSSPIILPLAAAVLDFHANTRDDERRVCVCVCVCVSGEIRGERKRWKEEGEVDPTVVVMGRRSRSSLNFHRTVPRWGPVGVVTIDSWPQLFRRLKKERLESSGVERHLFPTYISVCSRGQTTASLPTIWGHFTCFLTRLSRVVPFASPNIDSFAVDREHTRLFSSSTLLDHFCFFHPQYR